MLRENAWKLRGIVNGMDYKEWSPGGDAYLTSDGYRHYSVETLREGKAACKAALQRVRRRRCPRSHLAPSLQASQISQCSCRPIDKSQA